MTEWLAGNLTLEYPFVDGTTDYLTQCFADALVSAAASGPFTLTAFQPNLLTNAVVQVHAGSQLVLSTTSAVVTTLGPYTVLAGADAVRGSYYQFVVSVPALVAYINLGGPLTFDPSAQASLEGSVTSLNGLQGEVVLNLPNFSDVSFTDEVGTIGFDAPADRVDCSGTDCGFVFAMNGVVPDQFGSLVLKTDDCLRAMVQPAAVGRLVLADVCTACTDSVDCTALDAWLVSASTYFYNLAAIYTAQFNNYQQLVAATNMEIKAAQAASSPVCDDGAMFHSAVRTFNKPYFCQLVVGVTNASKSLAEVIIGNILGSGVWNYIPNSGVLQIFTITGKQFEPTGLSSSTFVLQQNETATYTVEAEMTPPTVPTQPFDFTGVWPSPSTWSASINASFPGCTGPDVRLTLSDVLGGPMA